jgi:hypothetical protein
MEEFPQMRSVFLEHTSTWFEGSDLVSTTQFDSVFPKQMVPWQSVARFIACTFPRILDNEEYRELRGNSDFQAHIADSYVCRTRDWHYYDLCVG